MGEAMLSATLDQRLNSPGDISISDINEARRQYLKQKYGVTVTSDNRVAAENGEVVVFAIKPQNLGDLMTELDGHLKPKQLVLSIIAGARIDALRRGLNHNRIIRTMPNTPAQIGQGITVWTATAEVTEQQREWTSSFLTVMGKEIYVDDEEYINMATAISGSGPAYSFLFVEVLVEAAAHIGLPHDMARELVLETILGSARLIQESGKEPSELRRMVTSPGGTTAAALQQLEQGEFANLIKQAVSAAYAKANKLGGDESR